MTTETKEIGIAIGIGNGTYVNTEYISGNIQLVSTGSTDYGDDLYVSEGYWESTIIDLVDKFQDYDRVVLSKINMSSDNVAILTRTSDDGVVFDEYIAVTETGLIQSETKRYIQIKLVFYSGFNAKNLLISDFTNAIDVDIFEPNEFIEVSGGSLQLKNNYSYQMTNDSSWTDTGKLYKQMIEKDKFIRIDKLTIS